MAKILKNTTLSNIDLNVTGLRIPASSQITINVTDYLILGSEESITELSTLINSGDIVVNDGTNDLFASKGIQYLKYSDNFINENTVYISVNGSDSTGDGTKNNPWASLTAVKSALDSGNITANPLMVKMDAGTITQAPVDFSSYTGITFEGSGFRTRLEASNINSDLLTLGPSMTLKDISLSGVTNSNNYLVNYSISGNGVGLLNSVFFTNASNGIILNNSTGTFRVTATGVVSTEITGTIHTNTDNTVYTLISTTAVGNGTTTTGVKKTGTGQLYLLTCRLTNMDIAIDVDGSGSAQLTGIVIVNCTRSLVQRGTGTILIEGGNFDASKSTIIDISKIEGFFINELPEETQLRVLSEFSVGLPNRGRESVFGQGDSYVLGMKVYTYNGTTYTDVSSDATDPLSGTVTFPNTSVNSAIYISTAFDTTSPLDWFGFKCIINTPAVLGSGDIVFEYYDGSTWVEFNHMVVQSIAPFEQFANSKFEVPSGSYQVLFDSRLEGNMTANDNPSFGINLKWIRLRIDSNNITTAPIFNQFKIHTSRFELEEVGFQNMYGLGRIEEKFPITFSGLVPSPGKSPADQDVFLSDTLGIGLKANSFPSNQNRSSSFTQLIPYELDTSCPIRLTIKYYGTSNLLGGIAFKINWATSKPGDLVYSSTAQAPTTFSNERSISGVESIGLMEANEEKIFSAELEIPEALVQESTGSPKAQLWVTIERLASDLLDTYAGSVVITDLAVFYTAYREGGYSGDFS